MAETVRIVVPAGGATDDLPSAGVVAHAWTRLIAPIVGLPLRETRVQVRGFQVVSPVIARRLEHIGLCFAHGYNAAVRCVDLAVLENALCEVSLPDRGFCFEGAAMGLALTDGLSPRRRWFARFLAGPAQPHAYMSWVGLGWALCRLPVRWEPSLRSFDSIDRWLALDGCGFHAGYFHWPRSVVQQQRPRGWPALPARFFDQGLGRSLWFVLGARPGAIATAIAAFDSGRHADLWAGVGLAATYAGGVDSVTLAALPPLAGRHSAALAQGAVFAAQARRRACNVAPHVAMACKSLLGLEVEQAAQIALDQLPRVGTDADHYQAWRLGVQQACAALLGQAPSCMATAVDGIGR